METVMLRMGEGLSGDCSNSIVRGGVEIIGKCFGDGRWNRRGRLAKRNGAGNTMDVSRH